MQRDRNAPASTGASPWASRPRNEIQSSRDFLLDYSHAGHTIGFDAGRAKGQLEASVDLARQWLLDLSQDDEWIATGMARAHWGQGWSELIARQASGVDW